MVRRLFAATLALALGVLGLFLLLPHLAGPKPPPLPERDPLSALSSRRSRPLTPRQVAALAHYGAAATPAGTLAPSHPLRGGFDQRFVLAGEPLRYAPDGAATVIGTVAASRHVPVLSERDGWALIRSGESTGWVDAGRLVRLGDPATDAPPLGSAPAPTLPIPASPVDPARLARAREHLDPLRVRAGRLGGWTLVTDVEDGLVLAFLDRVAERLEPSYRARYGLAPVGEPKETVVLFANETAYRRFRREEGSPAAERVAGHATVGLVALALGERGTEAAAESLVHELTHLLNRRAIGPALPPWLDEGLASDLGQSRIAADGSLVLGTLSSRRRPLGAHEILIDGGEATALVARRRVGSLVPFERLLELGPEEFLRPDDSELHYAQSLLFVRYLLDGAGGAHRDAFRGFLRAVSEGAPIDPEAFRAHLGPTWPRLQAGFESWLGLTVTP